MTSQPSSAVARAIDRSAGLPAPGRTNPAAAARRQKGKDDPAVVRPAQHFAVGASRDRLALLQCIEAVPAAHEGIGRVVLVDHADQRQRL